MDDKADPPRLARVVDATLEFGRSVQAILDRAGSRNEAAATTLWSWSPPTRKPAAWISPSRRTPRVTSDSGLAVHHRAHRRQCAPLRLGTGCRAFRGSSRQYGDFSTPGRQRTGTADRSAAEHGPTIRGNCPAQKLSQKTTAGPTQPSNGGCALGGCNSLLA